MGIVTVLRAAFPAISSSVTDDMLDSVLESNTKEAKDGKNVRSVEESNRYEQRVDEHEAYRGIYPQVLPLGRKAQVGEAEKPVKGLNTCIAVQAHRGDSRVGEE